MTARRVALAVTDGVPLYGVAIPYEVFGRRRPGLPDPWYDVTVCAPAGAAVVAQGGFAPVGAAGLDALAAAHTVVVPACADVDTSPRDDLVTAVRAAYDNGARIVSLCTGAFVLAAAGILDGRPATTHWLHAGALARGYPKVRVDPSVLYVDDGDVLTSAGSSAGLDLCLHIVRTDHGAVAANALARRLVAPAHRSGGQAQYVESAIGVAGDDGLGPLLQWALARLDRQLSVAELARRAHLTERTLVRRFHAATGTTPMRWLRDQRINRARELLETTALPVDRVGRDCGLGGPANFRRHFADVVGVPPSAYRRSFRTPAGAGRGVRA